MKVYSYLWVFILCIFTAIVTFSAFGKDLQDIDWFNENRWFITIICSILMVAMIFGPFAYSKLKKK